MENLLEVVDGTWKNIIKDLLWDVSMNIVQEYGEILVTDIQISDNLLLHAIYQHWFIEVILPNADACKQNMEQNLSVKAFNQGLIF